jgi:hypothetical protein
MLEEWKVKEWTLEERTAEERTAKEWKVKEKLEKMEYRAVTTGEHCSYIMLVSTHLIIII